MVVQWFRTLFARRRRSRVDVLDPFPPLDKRELRRERALHKAARGDGREERPETGTLAESATETRIRSRCERQPDMYRRAAERERGIYDQRITETFNRWRVSEVEGEETALVDDVIASGKSKIGPIDASAMQLKNSADQLLEFRVEHDLLHRLPVCHDVWRAMLILMIWFAAELVITTFLLRESGGLAMVFIISAVYCFLNCLFPFMVAPLARPINDRSGSIARNIVGWSVLAVLVAVGLWLNLLMGHYRSAALELRELGENVGSSVGNLEVLVDRVNDAGVMGIGKFCRVTIGYHRHIFVDACDRWISGIRTQPVGGVCSRRYLSRLRRAIPPLW